MSDDNRLHVRLSPESFADLLKYKRMLNENRDIISRLKKELKDISGVGKAQEFQQIRQQGAFQYTAGQNERSRRRVAGVIFDGTEEGRAISAAKERLKLAREHTSQITRQSQLHAAENMQVSKIRANVHKITDLKRLQELKETAILRIGLMKANGNVKAAQDAQALNRLIERRIAKLHEEIALQKEQAKQQRALLAAQRALSAQESRNRAREARALQATRTALSRQEARERAAQEREATRFTRSRADMRERVLGDGGAALMQVQAGLLGNYMMLGAGIGAITSTLTFVKDLDESLHNLQAIVNITDNNMQGMKQTILEVAESTKFYATELAEAAVNMGQAGLSATEIRDSLKSVALLATATGTDIKQSVDIVTSVMGVFGKTAGQTEQVVNTITQAVNDSKLSIDKLTLGLQYAGNTAAQSGVSFEELVAGMGAMANAGVRSGSTIGTGMRQLFISLENPSKKFIAELGRLGLTLDDISLQTYGFSGVLQNLHDAGFDAASAIRSFEVRGAAAFSAISGQIQTMYDLERSFVGSTAAARANETQMEALSNRGRQLISTFQSLAVKALEPYVSLLASVTAAATELVKELGLLAEAALLVGTAFLAVKAVQRVNALFVGLSTAATAAATSTAAGGAAMATTGAAAGQAATRIGVLSRIVGAFGGPWGLAATLVLSLGAAFVSSRSKSQVMNDELDRLQTNLDGANGKLRDTETRLKQVSDRIGTLNDRASNLVGLRLQLETQKIAEEFKEMGLALPNTISSVNDLTAALGQLKAQLAQEYLLDLQLSKDALVELMKGKTKAVGEQIQDVTDLRVARLGSMSAPRVQSLAQSGNQYGSSEAAELLKAWGVAQTSLQNPQDIQGRIRALQSLNSAWEAWQSLDKKALPQGIAADANLLFEGFREKVIEPIRSITKGEQEVRKYSERLGYQDKQMAAGQVRSLPTSDAAIQSLEVYQRYASKAYNSKYTQNLTPQQRFRQIQATEKYMDAAGKGHQAEIDRMAAQADALLQGAGDILRRDLEATRNTALADYETSKQQALEAVVEDMKAAVDKQRSDGDRYLKAVDQGIGQEMNPVRKRAMMVLREQMRERLAREARDMLTELRDAYSMLGKDEDVARLTGEIADLRLSDTADRAGSKADVKDFDQDLLDKRVEDAGTAASNYNAASGLMFTAAEQGIAGETDLFAKEAQLNAYIQTLRDRGDGYRRLLEDQLAAARAAGDTQGAIDLENQIEQERLATEAEVAKVEKQIAEVITDRREMDIEALERALEASNSTADTRLIRLKTKLKQTPQEDFDGRLDLLAQIAETERTKKLNRISVLDEIIAKYAGVEDSPEAAEAEQKREVLTAEIEADAVEFDKEQRRIMIEKHEEKMKGLQLVYDGIMAMKERIKDKEKLGELEAEAIAAAAALANGSVEGVILNNGTANDVERAKFEGAQLTQGTRDSFASRRKQLDKETGGGGRGRKSPGEQWTDTQKGYLNATKSMVDRGLISAAEAANTVAAAVAEAENRLPGVESQLTSLYSKISSGAQLTNAEQEKMTDLLKEQEGLLEIIRGKYSDIGAKMMLQGDVAGGLRLIMKEWAGEALDLSNVLQNGLLNVLNSGLTGLTDFFSSITDGTKKGKEAFRDLAVAVIKSLHQILAQMIAVKVMQAALGWLDPTGGLTALIPGLAKRGGGEVPTRAPMGVQIGHTRRFALGGANPNRDSQMILAQPGEFILRKSAVDMVGLDTLKQLNAQGNATVSRSAPQAPTKKSEGGDSTMNIYLIDDRSQAGSLGPNDIIAVISDDLVRGGTTKRLIKAIQMGNV